MKENYETVFLALDKVYSDDDFNCRGSIAPMDVADLAEDISKNGLQFPIAVQPAADVEHQLPNGYDFRIIAGHRRFKAWCVLKAGDRTDKYECIPAMVKRGLSETQARILNLGENLKRKELNILQEAKALQKLYEHGIPRDNVAKELGKSSGWVQTRYYLLDLPEEIQQEAAAGLLNQHHVKQLYSLRGDREKQYEAVKQFKDAKARGEKPRNVVSKKKSASHRAERGPQKVLEMIEFLGKNIGFGLHTRALAWASGHISTNDLFETVNEYCKENNKPTPDFPLEF